MAAFDRGGIAGGHNAGSKAISTADWCVPMSGFRELLSRANRATPQRGSVPIRANRKACSIQGWRLDLAGRVAFFSDRPSRIVGPSPQSPVPEAVDRRQEQLQERPAQCLSDGLQ